MPPQCFAVGEHQSRAHLAAIAAVRLQRDGVFTEQGRHEAALQRRTPTTPYNSIINSYYRRPAGTVSDDSAGHSDTHEPGGGVKVSSASSSIFSPQKTSVSVRSLHVSLRRCVMLSSTGKTRERLILSATSQGAEFLYQYPADPLWVADPLLKTTDLV
ncbi:unnamed protein product [Pleuronectes platessa]|uniref:Uncharacterized protein n=1 Tax=Pleuronectes platessa TaxID=8262 RepID=A0A9N7Z3C0_PLEPL|nr:unnamed protein product [Pleuronectes platessa]